MLAASDAGRRACCASSSPSSRVGALQRCPSRPRASPSCATRQWEVSAAAHGVNGWLLLPAAGFAAALPPGPGAHRPPCLRCMSTTPRPLFPAAALADGINVLKPSLMADAMEQQLPAPTIRCGPPPPLGTSAALFACLHVLRCGFAPALWPHVEEGRSPLCTIPRRQAPLTAAGCSPLAAPLPPPPLTCVPRPALPGTSLCSKSDAEFLEDGVEFVWGAEGVDVEELNNLFEKASGNGSERGGRALLWERARSESLGVCGRRLWLLMVPGCASHARARLALR